MTAASQRLPEYSPAARYGFGVLLVAAALMVEIYLHENIGGHYRFLALAPAVALSGWLGGVGPGLAAVALSLLGARYYLMGTALSEVDGVALAAFAGCWVLVILMADRVYRRLRREGKWRLEAERMASQADRLERFTGAISAARSTESVIDTTVREARHGLEADAGALLLVADDRVAATLARADGYGPHVAARWERVTLDADTPIGDAVLRSFTVVLESRAAFVAAYGHLCASETAHEATAIVPLSTGGRTLAVLRLDFLAPRQLTPEDRQFLHAIAPRIAHALDRAALYEAAERARAEAERQRERADQQLAERRRAEEFAQQARADAERANRLKDEFLSVVSHELRTPLNSIAGWASMLQKGQLDPTLYSRALQAIRDNAGRQANLIDELLDFSRIAAGRARLDFQEIDLRSVLQSVVDSVVSVAETKDVKLLVGELPVVPVLGDARRLEQVFFNLLGNAVKFTPAGGSVKLRTVLNSATVQVVVEDTGAGIDPAFLPYVFDRFRQGDASVSRNFGGLGLGLSIARQLVESHKGTISATSAGRGQGSTFVVELPLAGAASTRSDASEGESAPATAPRLDGLHVLVVDDEDDAREMMACALAHCGARVTLAARASDAIAILSRHAVDVIFADIAMPGQDGYSMIRQVRASTDRRTAAVPAVAVTAHVREDERRKAVEAGFQLHLAKPVEPSELPYVVDQLLRTSRARLGQTS